MTHAPRTRRAALVAAGALVLCACPGDDVPAQADTGTGTSTTASSLDASTSVGTLPGTTVDASSSGSDLDTTAGSTTTGSTGATSEATTSGTSTSDGTTMGAASSSGSSDSGGETGTGEQGYGDCFNNPALDVCLAGETCIDDAEVPPTVAVCALQDCGGAGECPSPPPGGTASPACMDVTGDMVDECVLQCTGGLDCPTGMVCFAEFVCVWAPELGPGDFSCIDQNLGGALGNAVALGNTVGQGNDFTPGCVMSNAPDVQLVWTAPADGTYTFDTIGSSFDTVLYAREDCVGPQLACNDDTFMTQSQIMLDLVAGQSVLLVMDGWNMSSGDYVLNIQ